MGLFSFFRKKPEKKETVSLAEAERLIERKLEEFEKQNEEIKRVTAEKVSAFVSDLKKQRQALDAVSVDGRKEDERLKVIVKENFNLYLSRLDKLIEKLNSVQENTDTEEYLEEVKNIVNDFKKNSFKNLQKATILIGDEIEQNRNLVTRFSQELSEIAERNRKNFEKVKLIKKLGELKESLDLTSKIKSEIKGNLSRFEKEKEIIETENKRAGEEFLNFKKSKEFAEFNGRKEKINSEISRLHLDISKLKEKIDLKSLLKQFHEIDKKRKLIREYRDNFLSALEKDDGLEILSVLSSPEIKDRILEIKERNTELKKQFVELEKENRIYQFEEQMKNLSLKVLGINEKIEGEKKKIIKLDEKERALQEEILLKTKEILDDFEIIS